MCIKKGQDVQILSRKCYDIQNMSLYFKESDPGINVANILAVLAR
jgi:hypothetical protein